MDPGDLIAQFCAVTNAEVDTATQYLEASGYELETAIGLFFASDGATAGGQTDAFEVRDRIEGTTDQLVDPYELEMEEMARESRRQIRQSRQRRGVFNQGRNEAELENMTPHERRLALLFRPPFDIIEDIDLEEAKNVAQEQGKWILINVQDSAEFQCQVLNRDLWKNQEIKDIISQSFVFLQYDIDSEDGEEYRTLYPFETFPHIAILDPWTGEQQRTWSKAHSPEHFVENLLEYIGDAPELAAKGAAPSEGVSAQPSAQGSAQPSTEGSAQPSARPSAHGSTAVSAQGSAQASAAATPAPAAAPAPAADTRTQIPPRDIPEATENATRIQLRTGDGRRVVHKFSVDAPVRDIYAFVGFKFDDLAAFTLTADRRNLESLVDETIGAANLKNSLVLIDRV